MVTSKFVVVRRLHYFNRTIAVAACLAAIVCLALASPGWCQSADFLKTKALAEQGDVAAQLKMGLIYDKGEGGVAKDEIEGTKWLRMAAESGDAEAQGWLGNRYLKGRGVEKDGGEAVRWFTEAAKQGEAGAQFDLALCYEEGIGVQRDQVEAHRWYFRAAQQGMPIAQYFLGRNYEWGQGVQRNVVEAYKWYGLAAAQQEDVQASEDARPVLTRVGRSMSREQITEAKHLVAVFIRSVERPTGGREGGRSARPGNPPDPSKSGPKATGTGFFITEDGFLMTNAHVVRDGAKFQLVTAAGLVKATVVRVDAANDLALLKAEGRFSPLPVTTSRGVRLGSTVATVGFPNVGLQGFAPKLAKGEIAAMSGGQDDPRYFQVSVPLQPGNSGGALVDERGNVVGIVSAKFSAQTAFATSGALPENVNYAVKSSFLLGFLESVPTVAAKLKGPNTKDQKFEDTVKSAEQSTVLVLVY